MWKSSNLSLITTVGHRTLVHNLW